MLSQAANRLPPPLIWRCKACGKRLADVVLTNGSRIVIKCRCGAVNEKAA